MKKYLLLLTLCISVFTYIHADIIKPNSEHSIKIGLALSGGGIRGLAHIGILEAFEENNINIDAISGTSMGAIIAALYASGYTSADIRELATETDFINLFMADDSRNIYYLASRDEDAGLQVSLQVKGWGVYLPPGITSTSKFNNLIEMLTLRPNYLCNNDFSNLQIPLKVIAANLATGEKVVYSSGNLAEAVTSSMSVPILFQPYEKDSLILVDGGLVDNLPVIECKEMGVDKVIAVDIGSSLMKKEKLNNLIDITFQSLSILMKEQVKHNIEEADIVIIPNTNVINNIEVMSNIDSLIAIGKEEALVYINDIKNLRKLENGSNIYDISKVTISGPCVDNKLETTIKELKGPVTYNRIKNLLMQLCDTGYYKDCYCEIIDNTAEFVLVPNPVLKSLAISGNTAFEASELTEGTLLEEGNIISTTDVELLANRIDRKYLSEGYVLAKAYISPHYSETGIVEINIDEGKIDKIEIEGYEETKPYVIRREINIAPGDILRKSRLQQSMQNIISTDLFFNTRFNIRKEDGKNILTFSVNEKYNVHLQAGANYITDKKASFKIALTDNNFLGQAHILSLYAKLGVDDKIGFKYIINRWYDEFITTTFDISFDIRRFDNEKEELLKSSIIIGGQNFERFGASFVSFNSIKPVNLVGNGSKNMTQYLALNSVLDNLDNISIPTSGYYLENQLLFSLDNDRNFMQYSGEGSLYYSYKLLTMYLHNKLVLSDGGLPQYMKPRFGWLDEFYGYKMDSINEGSAFTFNAGLNIRVDNYRKNDFRDKIFLSLIYSVCDWGSYDSLQSLIETYGERPHEHLTAGVLLETMFGDLKAYYSVSTKTSSEKISMIFGADF